MQTKRSIGCLLALAVILLAPSWAQAHGRSKLQGIRYKMPMGPDLDGDNKPDTVTIRERRSSYVITVHFTSGRKRLHLTVNRASYDAGLTIETSDVDNDHDQDLVVTTATSIRPAAVFLNVGKARFQRACDTPYERFAHDSGPTFKHPHRTSEPDNAVSTSSDPLTHPEEIADAIDVPRKFGGIHHSEPDEDPSDFAVQQIPPRGPPLPIHI